MTRGDRPAIALQDVAYGGLDAARAIVPVDLCAYLHSSLELGPQLYLRAPDLSTLDANSAFALFGSLRDVLGTAELGVQRLEIGAFQSVVLLSEGEISRGLFVFGRAGGTVTDNETAILAPLCSAIGVAAHALESAAQAPVDLSGLKVLVTAGPDGTSTAEAIVPVGGERRQGTANGATPGEAAARATLEALDASAALVGVGTATVGGLDVVVAVARVDGDLVCGAGPAGSADPIEAAAIAVANAACRGQG